MGKAKQSYQYLIDTIRRPSVELTRRQLQLRFAWELMAHCWRVLRRHRAEGMAAELTYRTIFSLIPLVVLGLVTFRVFGGLDTIENRIEEQLFSFFGVPDIPEIAYVDDIAESIINAEATDESEQFQPLDETIPVVPADLTTSEPSDDAKPPPSTAVSPNGQVAAEAEVVERRQVQASIRWALHELVEKVSRLNTASIGVFGFLLFVYAAIALADSVESVFNLIYDAPSERPIHLRVAIHWSIITLGSGLLAMSLYLSSQIVDYVSASTGWSISTYIHHALALLASWILLFLLYALMPNTRVSVPAAAVGAFVGAALWEFAKFLFQAYVTTAVPYSALYGSLGLIPLFLFWVYVTWFIILFGLVWTYTLQTAPGYVPSRAEDEFAEEVLIADPQWLLLLSIEVARAFERGEPVPKDGLQTRLRLPGRVVNTMIDVLEQAGIFRRIASEHGEQLLLGMPAHRILAADVIRLGRYQPRDGQNEGWKTLQSLREQNDRCIDGRTLADLVSTPAQ